MKLPSRTAVYLAMMPRRCSEVRFLGSGSDPIRSSISLSIRGLMDARSCSGGATSEVVIVILLIRKWSGGSEDQCAQVTYGQFVGEHGSMRLRIRPMTFKRF